MQLKLALVNLAVRDLAIPPAGLLYIASTVERDCKADVKLYDIKIGEEDKDIEKIIEYSPDIVGVSIGISQLSATKRFIKNIKKRIKNVLVIGGGNFATARPDYCLKELGVNLVCIGESEYTVRELYQKLSDKKPYYNIKGIAYLKNGKVKVNERRPLIENLNELPFPAYHLLDMKGKYMRPPGRIRGYYSRRQITVQTSRGCPGVCTYCSSHDLFGRKIRQRTVENVISEIKWLIKEYNIDSIYFYDDTLTVNKPWIYDFCAALKKENINLKWACQSRANHADEELFKTMKKAGCIQIDIGIESGSENVLKTLKKCINREQIINAFKIIRKVGMRGLATFIIGNPGETEEDIKQTIDIIEITKPDFRFFNFLTPYPGAELWEQSVENKWINVKEYYEKFDNIVAPQLFEPIMDVTISRERLKEIMDKLYKKYGTKSRVTYFKDPRFTMDLLGVYFKNKKEANHIISNYVKTRNTKDLIKNMELLWRKSF